MFCIIKLFVVELGLFDEIVSNEIIFELMLEYFVLVNRFIVCIFEGEYEKVVFLFFGRVEGNFYLNNVKEIVKLCWLSEVVLDILFVWL